MPTARALALLTKAAEKAKEHKRPLVLRLAAAIYYFVPKERAYPPTKPKKGEITKGGTYLGWPGLTTRVEVRDVAEAKRFETAFTTFCELLQVYGPRALAEKLEGLRPPK